jgi:hypothetical protein
VPVATLIGDLMGSRLVSDRGGVQEALVRALEQANAEVAAVQPLEPTIGDEFQGVYAELADAVSASLLVRLLVLPLADTRYGLGVGEVTVFRPGRTPLSQDGPGWWAARDAIEQVQAREGRRASARGTRTWVADRTAEAAALNAFLLCRDESVSLMGERARRLLLGWMLGRTQSELAAQEGISQSAVSQALGRSGAYALRDAQDALTGGRP